MVQRKIDLMKVHMPPQEVLMPALEEVIYSGVVTEGDKVREFEEKFQNKFGLAQRPYSTNSGTAALQLAYRLIRETSPSGKDIILTTPMHCFANVTAIVNEGFKIVWCDIDPDTGNISANDVEEKLALYGDRTAAVSFVDLAGFPNDIDKLLAATKDTSIPLIHDAAQSLGSSWDGYLAGSHPLISFTAFSFQAIKHLTTVDGGMLSINLKHALDPLARRLKWFGIPRESVKEETRWHYDITEPGYKFHMNNVNATIGVTQLDFLDKIIARHKDNGKWYNRSLKKYDGIKLSYIPDKSSPSYWLYPLRVERRDDFAKMMTSHGIGVNIAHVRNDSYSCMQTDKYVCHTGRLPGMDEYEKEYIFIPTGWWVSDEDREYIAECIKGGW